MAEQKTYIHCTEILNHAIMKTILSKPNTTYITGNVAVYMCKVLNIEKHHNYVS